MSSTHEFQKDFFHREDVAQTMASKSCKSIFSHGCIIRCAHVTSLLVIINVLGTPLSRGAPTENRFGPTWFYHLCKYRD